MITFTAFFPGGGQEKEGKRKEREKEKGQRGKSRGTIHDNYLIGSYHDHQHRTFIIFFLICYL